MTSLRTLSLATLVVAAALAAARARAEAPCVEDAARLCPGVPATGDGRLLACLQRNNLKLSSACIENLRWVQARARELSVDCANDVYRFCPGTQVGQGQVVQCLAFQVGKRELAPACEDAVVTALERTKEFQDACSAEAAQLCQGIQPGGGRLFLCLRAQSERVSTRCQRALNPR